MLLSSPKSVFLLPDEALITVVGRFCCKGLGFERRTGKGFLTLRFLSGIEESTVYRGRLEICRWCSDESSLGATTSQGASLPSPVYA